jgi:hypothetical protein
MTRFIGSLLRVSTPCFYLLDPPAVPVADFPASCNFYIVEFVGE